MTTVSYDKRKQLFQHINEARDTRDSQTTRPHTQKSDRERINITTPINDMQEWRTNPSYPNIPYDHKELSRYVVHTLQSNVSKLPYTQPT